jgi:Tannase-like family of unknown function (DUF6351)
MNLNLWSAARGFVFMVAVLSIGAAQALGAERDTDLLEVLSSRSDAVSGGDTLVGLRMRANSHWSAVLNGREVTASFLRSEGGEWVALLTGLRNGKNSLEIQQLGEDGARIDLINYPLSGPIFSGPHQEPFICQTAQNGLGPPLDADCSAKTVVQYYYKSTLPMRGDWRVSWAKALETSSGSPVGLPVGFKAYDPKAPPTDVAQTVTTEGRTVPYIIRREIGVINRAVYDIRFLHEPGQPLPTPWSRGSSGWNGRLVYETSGGCTATYHQGTLLVPASHEAIMAQGYAVAIATLNIFTNGCNDVLSAETLSMVKEHFIKEYGVPVHTIGWGDSAGAVQQYLIAQNYPGLLDGIIPYISFPDEVTTVQSTSDCSLLTHAFDEARRPWTDEQKTAVTGFATWRVCPWVAGFAIYPRNCPAAIPEEAIYDPIDRPKGVRCDIYDDEINVFGWDPGTGFAARPLDNVGVQYGLKAFNAGKLDAEQFVELNERVGGFDADGNIVDQRTQASAEVIERAYRSGVVLTGGGGLSETPIIDWRWYSDDQGDNHDSFRSLVTRARISAANGTAANQVILIDPPASTPVMTVFMRVADPSPQTSNFARRERELVGEMGRWLDNIAADKGLGPRSAKVARSKPPELVDGCWTIEGSHVVEARTYGGSGKCAQIYPPHGDPRIAAGGPLTDDVLKCSLKPLSAADYTRSLSVGQLQRLRKVFPTGVCDYTRPGIGQEIVKATWQLHSDPHSQGALTSRIAARAADSPK